MHYDNYLLSLFFFLSFTETTILLPRITAGPVHDITIQINFSFLHTALLYYKKPTTLTAFRP